MIPADFVINPDGSIVGPSGRPLRPWIGKGGYQAVSYVLNGTVRQAHVHALVCEAFHGPKPSPKHQVRHLDGDKLNNMSTNLTWGTPKQNHADLDRHGRRVDNRGERAGQAKLTWQQVTEIRGRYSAGGISVRVLAKFYGVSGRAIHKIVTGVTWKENLL